jgi:hypothetical protein
MTQALYSQLEFQHLLTKRLGGPQNQSEHIKEWENLHTCWEAGFGRQLAYSPITSGCAIPAML